MKTSILLIAYIFTLNVLVAQQNDIAFLDSNFMESINNTTNVYRSSLSIPNSIYLKESTILQSSSIVKQWRDKLANYSLKETSVFNDSEKSTYQVVFKNKQVSIIANYDNNGKIISTNETYKNIKMPFELRNKISKSHPQYSFVKNAYHITYSDKKGTEKQYYQIQIGNGNEKKTLKYDINSNPYKG